MHNRTGVDHWTTSLAKRNFHKKGDRYTIIPRSGTETRGSYSFNDLKDYYTHLCKLYDPSPDKVRTALKPDGDRYIIMEYCEDGSYWVKGWIIDARYEEI